jgi:hypothetical protein
LAFEFETKDLGTIHYFLGLALWERIDEIFLSQGKYTVEILKKFEILNFKLLTIPMMTNLNKRSVPSSNF